MVNYGIRGKCKQVRMKEMGMRKKKTKIKSQLSKKQNTINKNA